jgi:beta-phosphoglucomutase-like phosphatase (HAD superfamily)
MTTSRLPQLDPESVTTLLCDADGCLFPSEEPAFDASAEVLNKLLSRLGDPRRFTGPELRLATTGMNFRTTAGVLAAQLGVALEPDELNRWVSLEALEVTVRLRRTLRPDSSVIFPLERLAADRSLAVVSSSAMSRIAACLQVTGLSELFEPPARFSAEDLDPPSGKPDPSVYLRALADLDVDAANALAIEDSAPGVTSAVAAGICVVGNVAFVAAAERMRRTEELLDAGAAGVVTSWAQLETTLRAQAPARVPPAGAVA